jgi:hypothetical protein
MFIQLTHSESHGRACLVNLDKVKYISGDSTGTLIFFDKDHGAVSNDESKNDYLEVFETFEEVKARIHLLITVPAS